MTEPYIEVLLEGAADVPMVRHVLTSRLGLEERRHFRIHPHHGKGRLPTNPLSMPDAKHRGLLDLLPAKLRAYGKSLLPHMLVLVVVDVDDEDCRDLLRRLNEMLAALPRRPRVLFRLAIEETESWFLADPNAIRTAFPKAKISLLKGMEADAIVGAWERLAAVLSVDLPVTGRDKAAWADAIAPYLSLDPPCSPSLGKLLTGLKRYLDEVRP